MSGSRLQPTSRALVAEQPDPGTRRTLQLTVGPTREVVPGPGLGASIAVRDSNNNLDVIRYGGATWLAWRTAPSHFASDAARIEVVSTDEPGTHWAHEHTVAVGRDVREPRFFVAGGRLFLAYFTAGTSPTKFQPDRVWITSTAGEGWTEPVSVGPADTVVWRVRTIDGVLHMTVYRHAATMYTSRPRPVEVELWRSHDGLAWEPVQGHPVHVGGSEAEFIDLGDGRVLYVLRKEGPDGGWGSDLAIADSSAPGRLRRIASLPDKFDSPLLLLAGGRPVLVARRQVAFRGRFDLGLGPRSPLARTRWFQGVYWLTPKRTAVFEIDPDRLAVRLLGDLPSNGDTAFAGALSGSMHADGAHVEPLAESAFTVFNYSSRRDRSWWPWVLGQLRPTHIYRCELRLTPSPDAQD